MPHLIAAKAVALALAGTAVLMAAGCSAHPVAVTAAVQPAAASVAMPEHNPHSCGLPYVNVNKHRSRAKVERYARRALACARREHRSAYYPVPGDRVCLMSDFTLAASSGGAAIYGPVTLAHPVAPGQSEPLPPVYVKDKGDQPETMVLRIANDYPFCSDVLPPSWISGTGKAITLSAGEGEYVRGLIVTVPAGTEAGIYRSDIAVAAPGGTGEVSLGAAAATEIRIVVP